MLSAAPAGAVAPAGQQDPTAATAIEPGAAAASAASAPRVIPPPLSSDDREGRPIVAVRQGNARATKVLLVLGQMHGNETRALLVVDAVRRLKAQTLSNVAI